MEQESFLALGLGELEGRVLAIVVAEEEVTAATLCAATGSHAPAISVAVRSLIRQGLLERVPNRRPSLIFLHPQAPQALAPLIATARDRHEQRQRQVDEAAEAVARAAARRVERGRPHHELEPLSGRDRVQNRAEWRGKTSHDEVVQATDLVHASAARSRCPARLLVMGEGVDVEQVARRQRPGSEVRATTAGLPRLRVLDGQRIGVVAGTRHGPAMVWSRDECHVRAVTVAFEQWWEQAGGGVVTPYPVEAEEEGLEVDEWDPEDVASG
jgi:DNA-binding MarR family transcriptional regulator